MKESVTQAHPPQVDTEMELLNHRDMDLFYQDHEHSSLRPILSEQTQLSISRSADKEQPNIRVSPIEDWPASASVLKRESRSWSSVLVDIGFVAATLPLFTLGIAVFCTNGKEVDIDTWNLFQNAIQVVSLSDISKSGMGIDNTFRLLQLCP